MKKFGQQIIKFLKTNESRYLLALFSGLLFVWPIIATKKVDNVQDMIKYINYFWAIWITAIVALFILSKIQDK